MSITFDFPVIEQSYKDVGHRKLNLYIFEPEIMVEDRPAILFFHGGSFVNNELTPARFQHQANFFRSKGIVSICVDYRCARDDNFTPEHAILDARSAIRWVRANCKQLKINRNRVVMCGASSGGYTCLSSVMLNHLLDDEQSTIDHIPNAIIIYNAGVDGVDIMTRLFPELLEKADELSPINYIKPGLPPMITMVGDLDIIYDISKKFCERMEEEGNAVEFITYQGMNHGFFNYGFHDNIPFDDTNRKIVEFLTTHNIL